nr:hypothetical protein [uncultured Bacteroides sp.]
MRQQDVKTPQRRTEPTQNRTVTPRRSDAPVRQSRTTERQETKKQETPKQERSTSTERRR